MLLAASTEDGVRCLANQSSAGSAYIVGFADVYYCQQQADGASYGLRSTMYYISRVAHEEHIHTHTSTSHSDVGRDQ